MRPTWMIDLSTPVNNEQYSFPSGKMLSKVSCDFSGGRIFFSICSRGQSRPGRESSQIAS